jgi:hypothetical protein
MPNIPFRGLSEKGILYDPSPYQLDLNAWSGGSNVRFHGNLVMRSPIWREVFTTLPSQPRYAWARRPSTGQDVLFLVGVDGNLYSYSSGALEVVTPPAGPMVVSAESFTSSFSGDVSYINSPASVPLYWGPSSDTFATLPGWDSTWNCVSLRAFSNYVVALNVTKGAVATPNMVKWSDITLAGLPPANWNADDPTSNAGENPLEDLTTPIIDGLAMRSIFVIYSQNQIWAMQPSGDNFIFTFQALFSEGGIISPNCVVEVDGSHYVFGPTDVYTHDGVTKQSIIDGRNRDYVYRNMDTSNLDACFVNYNPALNEIMFAYPSGSGTEFFANQPGRCNRAAIYSITGDSWSFVDLPSVTAMTQVNVQVLETYANIPTTTTYANVGGSYFDCQSGPTQTTVSVSQTLDVGKNKITLPRVLAYDFVNNGRLTFPFSTECNGHASIQKTGIDLEQVGSDLTTYKVIRRIFPLVTLARNTSLNITVGSSDTPSGPITWGTPNQFNPITQYKIDVRRGSRYLAILFGTAQEVDFAIEGFDLDVAPGGTR